MPHSRGAWRRSRYQHQYDDHTHHLSARQAGARAGHQRDDRGRVVGGRPVACGGYTVGCIVALALCRQHPYRHRCFRIQLSVSAEEPGQGRRAASGLARLRVECVDVRPADILYRGLLARCRHACGKRNSGRDGRRRLRIRKAAAGQGVATVAVRSAAHTYLLAVDTHVDMLVYGTDAGYGVAAVHPATQPRIYARRYGVAAYGVAYGHCRGRAAGRTSGRAHTCRCAGLDGALPS